MDNQKEDLGKFQFAMMKFINSIETDNSEHLVYLEISKDLLTDFVLDKLNDDRCFAVTEDLFDEEGSELYVNSVLNFITLTKKENSEPITLNEFVENNLDIVDFEISTS